jgi:hypothetical protein
MRRYLSPYIIGKFSPPRYVPNNWIKGTCRIDTGYGYQTVEAELMGQFAVHKMFRAPGYCITYAALGFRITSRDRVFRDDEWAKYAAEMLHPLSNDWGNYMDFPIPEILEKKRNYIFDLVEYEGGIRNKTIAPADRITKAKLKQDW